MRGLIYSNFNNQVVNAIKDVITSNGHKPLYVYGPAGTGKSFLMKRMRKKYPGRSQVLKSSDIKKSEDTEYTGCDLLILEDINTISSRSSASKKISELLKYFVENKKQIVFTANCTPSRLKLSKKFISEIKKGVVVSIKKFDEPSKRKVLSALGKDLSPEILERLMGDNIKTISQAIKAVEKVREILNILREEKKKEETLKMFESPEDETQQDATQRSRIDTRKAQEIFFELIHDASHRADAASKLRPEEEKIFKMILPALERLVRQVERTFEHYASNFDNERVEKIYISSGIRPHSRIVDYIGDQLDLPRLGSADGRCVPKCVEGARAPGIVRRDGLAEIATAVRVPEGYRRHIPGTHCGELDVGGRRPLRRASEEDSAGDPVARAVDMTREHQVLETSAVQVSHPHCVGARSR